MYKNLFPGMIGLHHRDTAQSIALAQRMGFGGIDIDIRALQALAASKGIDHCRRLFEDSGIHAGNWIMPNAWKFESEGWLRLIDGLPDLARLSVALGCTRSSTYFSSGSDELDFGANFAWHVRRLQPICAILADHGIGFGMEFMGPLSVRQGKRYAFIHNLGGMLELAGAIGTGNVGLLLDSWHLFTSGDGLEVLDPLSAGDVINVHINDAPLGLDLDTCEDCDRRIPLETGVINLPGFLSKLQQIGYAGPITPEPFSARLNAIAAENPDRACRIIAEAMDRLWILAGLAPMRAQSSPV